MIDSRLVKDALDFALSNEALRKRIDARDADERVVIDEIRIKRYKYDPEKNRAIFKLGIDYTTLDQSAPDKEDLIMTLGWKDDKGFHVLGIKAVKEIGS